MKKILEPKYGPGPESSLKEFPLLYLYFDNFAEIRNAAKQGAFDVGMIRSYEGIGDYRFEGILADEERFLDFYRNGALRLRLNDGTILSKKYEKMYWDRVENPENYKQEPPEIHSEENYKPEPPEVYSDIHARNRAESWAELKRLDYEINAKVEAIKRRYGMGK